MIHETFPTLTETASGKMDTVLIIQMACEERLRDGEVFGPKNCHVSVRRPHRECSFVRPKRWACGKELFKEFEYVLATTEINVKLASAKEAEWGRSSLAVLVQDSFNKRVRY